MSLCEEPSTQDHQWMGVTLHSISYAPARQRLDSNTWRESDGICVGLRTLSKGAWPPVTATDYMKKAVFRPRERSQLAPHCWWWACRSTFHEDRQLYEPHRSGQIPPRANKNTNWIYWIQGVCLNESLASFVFWFGRMMLRFLHENPLYTSCRSTLIVTQLSPTAVKIRTHMLRDMFIKWTRHKTEQFSIKGHLYDFYRFSLGLNVGNWRAHAAGEGWNATKCKLW